MNEGQMKRKCAKIDCYEPTVRQVLTTNKQGLRITVWLCLRHHAQAADRSTQTPEIFAKVEW